MAKNRDAFLSKLVNSISSYGDILSALARVDESIQAYVEAGTILRPLLDARPQATMKLWQANLKNLRNAFRVAEKTQKEITEILQRLGVSPNDLDDLDGNAD